MSSAHSRARSSVVDASILVPTFRHVRLLPFSLASALDQNSVSVEVLVVGDGVEDETREVLARHADDPRVRFFDFPKGTRNGEAYRHEVFAAGEGRIVAYLCDDDLLLPDHVATMSEVLAARTSPTPSRRASPPTESSSTSRGTRPCRVS